MTASRRRLSDCGSASVGGREGSCTCNGTGDGIGVESLVRHRSRNSKREAKPGLHGCIISLTFCISCGIVAVEAVLIKSRITLSTHAVDPVPVPAEESSPMVPIIRGCPSFEISEGKRGKPEKPHTGCCTGGGGREGGKEGKICAGLALLIKLEAPWKAGAEAKTWPERSAGTKG